MIALEVRAALSLDRMVLVVANDPWQKADRQVTPAATRFVLVAEAVERVNARLGQEVLEASDLEIRRGGDTYSADTLEELRSSGGDELFLLVGSDAAAGLDSWSRPEVIRDLATTVVVERGGRVGGRPPAHWDHVVVSVPVMEVSSSDLRARFVDGRPVEALMPPTVIDGVRRLGLYESAQ
jgi:nicotinate-nucleotide adenylyltransferase